MMANKLILILIFWMMQNMPSVLAQTVSTITIENRTPDFELIPSIEVFGSAPKTFLTVSPGVFRHDFQVSEDDWFNKVNIKLLWRQALLTGTEAKVDFEQRLSLRIRNDFPERFSINAYFSNDRSQREMLRLERNGDVNQQFEKYFRGHQIATFYRDTVGADHPLTQRAVNIFFTAAVNLAKEPSYFVIMSDEAEQMAQDTFGAGSQSYGRRATEARSVYWFDLSRIDKYVSKGDCRRANLMLQAFKTLESDDPTAFKARYGSNSKVLAEKSKIVEAKCSS